MNKNSEPSKYDVEKLNTELERTLQNFIPLHAKMAEQLQFYKNSAVYPALSGETKTRASVNDNLLRVFADKNIHYTSPMLTFKVPTTGSSPEQRQSAGIREKIIYGVHRKSGTKKLQKKWAKDATLKSMAIAETGFDLKNRCAFVRRYNPAHVVWQMSNGNDSRVMAFWAIYPITTEEAKERYGITPVNQPISTSALANQYLSAIDGKDWFLHAIRWDDNVRVSWIGDKIVEEPHQHQMGSVPIDIAVPFDEDETTQQHGSFYLDPLIPLQAELNHTIKQRSNIVKRMANPVIWGRNIVARQFDDVKQNLNKAGGGFVGLKQGGELGMLQVNDVKLLNEHEDRLIQSMMRHSGFSAASFGESVGANTSGDALGMYFTPTQRLIEDQNISWVAFYESINAKILKMYDKFLRADEKVKLSGYSPRGTLQPMGEDNDNKREYISGGFDIEFDKSVIDGNYTSIAIPKPITPKNEIEDRRLLIEAVREKIISRHTAHEEWGIDSPEDEFALLTQEQSEPVMNPQGMQQLMAADASARQLEMPPTGAPANVQLPPISR